MIIIPEDVLRIAEALSAPIEELGLSVRSYNGLRRWGITTVADVYRAYQDKQLPRIRNLGEKSVIEIEKHLEEHLAKVAPASSSEFPNSSDCISRQAAIDTLTEYGNGRAVFISVGEAVIRIEQLPPTQLAPDQNGDLWVTVPDIDDVTCIYVQESKSKFCRIFYEEQEQPKRIIHCKDCKHFVRDDIEEYTPYGFYNTYFHAFCDKHWDNEQGEFIDVKIDDFCSFAERREVTE